MFTSLIFFIRVSSDISESSDVLSNCQNIPEFPNSKEKMRAVIVKKLVSGFVLFFSI